MPELEIHHESGHAIDPIGQKVGVLAALLAVLLAVVTIASHRTHTAAIIHKTDANDQWSLYQAIRVKAHTVELGQNMATILDAKGAAVEKMLADYASQMKKYDQQAKESLEKAQHGDEMTEADEHRALRYDLGEGLLEIGLVLTSLYFISKKMMFPVLGVVAGVGGSAIAASGLLLT